MPRPRKVSDPDILRVLALSSDPAVSAPEISAEVRLTREAVNQRLSQLSESGLVEAKKVGAAAKIYWLSDAGQRRVAAHELGDRPCRR